MPRATNGTRRTARRKKITSQTKGFWGRRKNVFRTAKNALERAFEFAYRDRRVRKRDFRRLWIARINAACRNEGISYSRFMAQLKHANIHMNRKLLSHLAVTDKEAFHTLVHTVSADISPTKTSPHSPSEHITDTENTAISASENTQSNVKN